MRAASGRSFSSACFLPGCRRAYGGDALRRPFRASRRQARPEATLVLRDWRAFRRFASRGEVGFAEAYMAGEWTTPDLTALIELAATNVAKLEDALAGFMPVRLFRRMKHLLRSNTKVGSRRKTPSIMTWATISISPGSIRA